MTDIRRHGTRSNERTRAMADELVEHLEEALGISNLEDGPKLVGAVIAQKLPNKGAIKNILKAAWKNYGETRIVWVMENRFAITVSDENMADKIINNGPWSVMKCCFAVKRWPPTLAIEEVQMDHVPHWIQIRGIPLNLCHEENMIKVGSKAGEVIEFEDLGRTRGFLRVRVEVDTNLPLVAGFWLPRIDGTETWEEYQYERLADFCYRCGRIGHVMDTCIFEEPSTNESVYGEWTRAKIIREFHDPKPPTRTPGRRRRAATVRQQHREGDMERVSHEAREEGSFHMCQSQPGFGELTSDQTEANGQYERSRTLEISSVCQAPQEPRHTHQLYPRQAAQIENLGDGNTIILGELNVETSFSRPHNRVNPRSDVKELEWDRGHVTRGNTFITNGAQSWARRNTS
ncbi:uncharacterized protein Pyn_18501 [Prunus yedoensis var. nudiflora]|uniref:CCHC-type domain-containing protein n=1 Tax=Prunus yedoensis var. nudiflora TaxID=2094558 RepID=A0A314Y1Q2_PRUYE|nr:uncharacterized protein Pyn_18501 [Prunus yedoensis var. nudiflora]